MTSPMPRATAAGRAKAALPAIALALCGVGLSALLAEAAVLLVVGEQPKFPRHVVGAPFGVRINEPHARYRHKSADVTIYFAINSRGLRAEREYAYEKPHGVRRVVSLGDSYTFGHEVRAEETFSAVLEARLRAMGVNAEVLNAGVSGFGTAEQYVYLERELLKYSPDVVVVSFYGNDLVDNVRSGLFALRGSELVRARDSYVPLGRLGDALNRNPVMNFLSERSNAFTFFKERITELLKKRAVQENLQNTQQQGTRPAQTAYARRLTAALFERLYQTTRQRGIRLVVHSIPFYVRQPRQLVDAFPSDLFDTERDGLSFVSAKQLLDPYIARELLYYERSQGHWTPLSHRVAGEALADAILGEGLSSPAR